MRRAWLLPALVLALAGCGGGGASEDAKPVLARTASNLARIHSGDLDLRLLVTPSTGKGRVGFELQGPFELRGGGPLPVARVEYTQIAGTRSAAATLISTGRQAYVD